MGEPFSICLFNAENANGKGIKQPPCLWKATLRKTWADVTGCVCLVETSVMVPLLNSECLTT